MSDCTGQVQKQLADPLTKIMDPGELIAFLETGRTKLLSPSTASKKRARHKNKYDQTTADEPECNYLEVNEELDQWYEEAAVAQAKLQDFWKFFYSYFPGQPPEP